MPRGRKIIPETGPAQAVVSKKMTPAQKHKANVELLKAKVAAKEQENNRLLAQIREAIAAKNVREQKEEPKEEVIMTEETVDVAPIAEEPVIEEKKIPVTQTYHKIRFRNLLDPEVELAFTYNGKSFNLPDGAIIPEIRKEVVDHLNSLQIVKTKNVEISPGMFRIEETARPRVLCEILDTFEKEV